MDGTSTNGNGPQPDAPVEADPAIIRACELTLDSRSTNQYRNEALEFLDKVKAREDAPQQGYNLAANTANSQVVRNFGIQCLMEGVKYRWDKYSPDQAKMVRGWVIQLTQGITASDPRFYTRKVAQFWVEVAKRSWMLDWIDMDELLVQIWQGGPLEKFFVMEVLENMAENSFGKDDSFTAIRGDDLSNFCLEIFTPAAVFREYYPKRENHGCRHGDEGWLFRVGDFLSWCLANNVKDATVGECAVKAAIMLKSSLEWVPLKAVHVTESLDRLLSALESDHNPLILEALQCLFLLFCRRPKFQPEDVNALVVAMLNSDNMKVLGKIYNETSVSPEDIDDELYLICKKLTPLLFQLGLFVEERLAEIYDYVMLDAYFDLLLEAVQNKSLHVSIPIMHLWALLMASPTTRSLPDILSRVGKLLEICSDRLVRYEDMSPDIYLPELAFLHEDVETQPERHQFLGNYTRFAKDVVDGMVQQQPKDALQHILNQTSELLTHMYDDGPPFDGEDCDKYPSIPALRLDAKASVIEAAVFGYAKWRTEQRAIQPNQEEVAARIAEIDSVLENWVAQWLSHTFDDPAVQQKLVIIFISIAVGPLRKNQQAVSSIFQYIMKTKMDFIQRDRPPLNPTNYDNFQDELQRFCSHQLQRLAVKSYDFLAPIYDEIEKTMQDFTMLLNAIDDDRERVLSVPFIILQRATALPEDQRRDKLRSFVESRLVPWQDAKLDHALQGLEEFCQFLGLTSFQDEFLSRNAPNVADWSTVRLETSGAAFKNDIDFNKRHIPIRITRTILGASVDRADGASLEVAKHIWGQYIPALLPKIVQLTKLSIQFSAPAVWDAAPQEQQTLIRRIMRDRFWQVGISSGTRDDFYNKVTSTRDTLEGLASAIRGCIRDVRETCLKIIALFTFFGDAMYQLDGLAPALCEALFSHPMALSTHQTVVLLETARALIEQCPKEYHEVFLPPITTALFQYLDEKISREWNVLSQKKSARAEDDDLTEEMKEESILRNLTFTTVTFVARLFDQEPARFIKKPDPGQEPVSLPQRFDAFIMENLDIFKAVITFCTHALRIPDSRCCTSILKVLRTITPNFARQPEAVNGGPNVQLAPEIVSEVREFISTEVFKACIESLNDSYFVDIQPDLAGLIARIMTSYAPLTPTPRNILLSLPDITEDRVDHALRQMDEYNESRKQKSIVLKLLAGVRGVSLAEQGKIQTAREKEKKEDTTFNKYAQSQVQTADKRVKKEAGDDDGALEAVADMFQGA